MRAFMFIVIRLENENLSASVSLITLQSYSCSRTAWRDSGREGYFNSGRMGEENKDQNGEKQGQGQL